MTKLNLAYIPLLALSLIFSCSGSAGGGGNNGTQACPETAGSFASSAGVATGKTKWLYQLQNADPVAIAASGFDILTIDYSLDGSDAGAYTAAQIKSLRTAGKTVLAYLSIGEAEDYRYYFNSAWVEPGGSGLDVPTASAPCWLGATDAEWLGNFKVQYWSEAWQLIVLGYLDKIIDAGFEGVYLDIIDGFYYWSAPNSEGVQLSEEVAALRMMNLVKRIALHARVTRGKPKFLIFPQNGEGILDYDTDGGYMKTISGFGIEDLYHDGTVALPPAETALRTPYLGAARAAGRQVLVVDYVDDGNRITGVNSARITDFHDRALAATYNPYVGRSDRALDTINIITGIQE